MIKCGPTPSPDLSLWHIAFVCLIVLGSGGMIEYIQLLTLIVTAEFLDAVEKIAGGA